MSSVQDTAETGPVPGQVLVHLSPAEGRMTQPIRRRDLAIPAGWKVTHHSTVQVLDHATLHPADLPVRGQWRALDRSPDGWWIKPADDTARWWLSRHGARAGAASGCISVHAQRLVPGWLQLTLPGT